MPGRPSRTLSDSDLTKLRRQHIGFIFQFFNLLPMLTAEENILLPLSIAGVKPDREWVDQLIERMGLTNRRTHRPSELSGGQQQRVAIGRALVSRPTIVFADEPTGNLDSKTSGEILEVLNRSVQELEQTIVMVTHEARAAAIARPRPVPRRRAHRPRVEGSFRARDRRRDGTARQRVTRFALKALLGRKLRTVLSAFAIVLGVATVSGTYVLTDSIDKAFGSIFTESRNGSDAVISGKAAFDIGDGTGVAAPAFDESLLQKVRALPDVSVADGSVNGEAQLIGKDGKAIVYGGAPNLGFSIARGDSPFNPLALVDGSWPKTKRGRDRQGDCG